jgi:hypothetical protein
LIRRYVFLIHPFKPVINLVWQTIQVLADGATSLLVMFFVIPSVSLGSSFFALRTSLFGWTRSRFWKSNIGLLTNGKHASNESLTRPYRVLDHPSTLFGLSLNKHTHYVSSHIGLGRCPFSFGLFCGGVWSD